MAGMKFDIAFLWPSRLQVTVFGGRAAVTPCTKVTNVSTARKGLDIDIHFHFLCPLRVRLTELLNLYYLYQGEKSTRTRGVLDTDGYKDQHTRCIYVLAAVHLEKVAYERFRKKVLQKRKVEGGKPKVGIQKDGPRSARSIHLTKNNSRS